MGEDHSSRRHPGVAFYTQLSSNLYRRPLPLENRHIAQIRLDLRKRKDPFVVDVQGAGACHSKITHSIAGCL